MKDDQLDEKPIGMTNYINNLIYTYHRKARRWFSHADSSDGVVSVCLFFLAI